MKRFLLFLIVFPLATLQAQVNYQALNQYIAKARANFGVTGLAVGVVQNGDVVFQNGYGLENAEDPGSKVTTYSTFEIASISKGFTTMALAQLVDEGKLNWNDKVTTHLPDFKLYDPVATSLLTVEDLVTHRSGLQTFDGDLLWYGTSYTLEEALSRIQYRAPSREFRLDFGYQNLMFMAAASIIEKISKQSWGEYMESHFIQPLGMQSTTTSLMDYEQDQKIALPHIDGKPIDRLNFDNAWGAVGIHTTVTDMAKWMRFILAEGKHQGDSLLSGRAVRTQFEMEIPIPVSSYDVEKGIHFKGYGKGWFLMDYEGTKVVHHGGGLPGYISKIVLVPEKELGMIILTNDMSSLPTALMYKLLDEFLGKKGRKKDWATEFLSYKKNKAKQDSAYQESLAEQYVKKPSHSVPLEQFVGTYEDKMYGKARVYLQKRKLMLELTPSKTIFTSVMEPWDKDLFLVTFKDEMLPEGLVSFSYNETTKAIEGFEIDLPNPDFHFYKLNFKRIQ